MRTVARSQDYKFGDELLPVVGAHLPRPVPELCRGPGLKGTLVMKIRPLLMALVVSGFAPGVALGADDVFDSNGVKIRFVTEGSGEAVVLIHGWMGDSSMWGRDGSG